MLAYRPRDLAILTGISLIWGTNFVVVKIGLDQLPPLLFVALRFVVVAAMLVPFVEPPRGQFRKIFLLSITLGLLHFSMMFVGLRTLDASTAAIAIQLQVPFAAILAALLYKEKLGWQRAFGMAIAFAGVALIAGEPRLNGQYLALALVIVAACLWSVASIQMRGIGSISATAVNAWMALFGIPQLLVASLLFETGQWEALTEVDWRPVFAILYQAVFVVVIGYGAWYKLVRKYELNQVMPFTLLVPVVGVASAVIFLGEALTAAFIIGGCLTVMGVAFIVFRRAAPASTETGAQNAGVDGEEMRS